ncbi:MAG: hypothetical protein F6K35_36230 [Okeania sp. SIO2H7]|nr:hypothetical protein [Okeania sp. SIO2H7]
MKGSFAKYAKENNTQVTFYYIDGQTETFSIPMSPEDFQQQLPSLLQKRWLTFHLIDQTVCLATERVVKFEIKPPISQLQGASVLSDCQRVTALQRSSAR